jgi:hypothetical protein
MRITRTSMISGNTNTMELPVTEEQLEKYYGGELLQNAFPNLSAGQREFIKTGITEQEWDDMFNGTPDGDEKEVEVE